MGQRPFGADYTAKTLSDSLDEVATILCLYDGDTLIGLLRSIRGDRALGRTPDYPKVFRLDAFDGVPPAEVTFTSQLIIAPEWRSTRALGRLLEAVYAQGRQQRVWLDLVFCEASLVSLYEVMGYRRYLPNTVEVASGIRVPLALVADDVPYLKSTRSPLARMAKDFPTDPQHGRWFAERFSAYAQPSCARLMGVENFLGYITERVHAHADAMPLLAGLDARERGEVLRAGTLIRAQRGDKVLRAGDAETEMYMLLSGAVEVRTASAKGAIQVVDTLGKGQVFGEMSFLSGRKRSADIVAISAVEVLALRRDMLEKLMSSAPAAASRLLLNLSMYLCERLHHTTRALVDFEREGRPA